MPAKFNARRLIWGMAIGLLVTAIGGLLLIAATSRGQRLPTLTAADFDRATERWDKNGPANYDLDIELAGNRPGKIHVEVRDGQAVHMVRDGYEPEQKRTWYAWTVPGQFDTIEQEQQNARSPSKSYGAGATEVLLYADFDPTFGYPHHVRRIVLGTNNDMEWTVTRFEKVEPGTTSSKTETGD